MAPPPNRTLMSIAFGMWAVVFLVVYGVTMGHGLVKDDFSWILHSRIHNFADLGRVLRSDNGFYRPVVALTFALDERFFGVEPWAYGATNLVLALACGAAVMALVRALKLSVGAAVLAGAIWLLNFHGVHWAILWVSGRTALVLTLAATVSAWALVRRRLWLAVLALGLALFAKEEAVLLGPILLGWLLVFKRSDPQDTVSPLVWVVAAGVMTGLYLVLRSFTSAMTPLTAPTFYRFTFAPSDLGRNILEYLDRAATLPAIVAIGTLAVLRWPRGLFNPRTRTLTLCGLIWLVGGYGITVFVPVRSELYACFPSVGPCLIAAVMCARAWELCPPVLHRRALVLASALPVLLSPIYYSRTARWVTLAEFSSATLADLDRAVAPLTEGATVSIQDDETSRNNMAAAFGSLIDDAVLLTTGKKVNVSINPSASLPATVRLKVADGRLVVVTPSENSR